MKMNVYPATKHAVRAATKILENELLDSKIKVSVKKINNIYYFHSLLLIVNENIYFYKKIF